MDRVLSSLGLPGWFRHAYLFEYHAHVRLRFKLASGLGEPTSLSGRSAELDMCSSRVTIQEDGVWRSHSQWNMLADLILHRLRLDLHHVAVTRLSHDKLVNLPHLSALEACFAQREANSGKPRMLCVFLLGREEGATGVGEIAFQNNSKRNV